MLLLLLLIYNYYHRYHGLLLLIINLFITTGIMGFCGGSTLAMIGSTVLPEAFAMDLGVWVVCHENLRATPRCAAVFDGLVSGLDDYVRSGGRS